MKANTLLFIVFLATSQSLGAAEEIPVTLIPLAAPLDQPAAEISGLTWCKDTLIVMPQYPDRLNENGISHLYGIEKMGVYGFLNGTKTDPLSAQKIVLEEADLRTKIPFFDGYEALACQDNQLWLSIEAGSPKTAYQGYVVKAEFIQNASQAIIRIDTKQIWSIPSNSGLHNMGEEALLLAGNQVLTLHEINDPRLMSSAQASSININNGLQSSTPFPHLPYRITDSTELDEQNRFWVMNYKYSGDKFSRSATDLLVEQYGEGASHKQYYNVERLVEFEITKSGIKRVERAPLQLQMIDVEGRNWEGLVRLDNRGFLIATDKHPATLLGFVPYPTQALETVKD